MDEARLLENDRSAVRKKFGKSDDDVREYVDSIKRWFDQQPHLPEVPSDELIEYFLVSNKFSTEKTKSKLDMYYTIRSLVPEIFRDTQPEQPHIQETANVVIHCPLPKLTAELYRVEITKVIGDPAAFNPYYFFAYQLNMNEIRFHEDLNMGDVLIVDLQEVKLGHILKITPTIMRKVQLILEDVFSNRVKGVHLINSPQFVDKLVTVLKSVMKQKMIERVHVHTDSFHLTDFISKEVLPRDYGGDELSIEELSGLWKKKLDEYKDRFNKLNNLTVDESVRPTPLKNHELLGYYGNFRSLNID